VRVPILARKNRKKKAKAPARPPRAEPVRSEAAKPPRARATPAKPSPRVHEVFGIVTLAAALLLGPSLVTVQTGDGLLMGPFGQAVGRVLNYLLGLGGYLLILALLVAAIRIFAGGLDLGGEAATRRALWRERIGLFLLGLSATTLLHLLGRPERLAGASLGGILGEACAELLCAITSTPGAWILTLAGLALALVLTTRFSWARTGLAVARLARALAVALREGFARSRRHLGESLRQLTALLRRRELAAEAGGEAALPPPVVRLDLADQPEVLVGEEPPRRRSRKAELAAAPPPMPEDLEISARREIDPEPEPREPEESAADPFAPPAIVVESELDGSVPPASPEEELEPVLEVEEEQVLEEHPLESVEEPTVQPSAASLMIVEPKFEEGCSMPADEAPPPEQRVEPGDGPGFELYGERYRPPPLSLLEFERSSENAIDREAIYRQAERLVRTLADYKIVGQVTEVHPGPVVTMYEFVPAPGTRISKIANLTNDLAMSLAAQRVRIVAPIPGKGAVGIEVPNEKRETVYFKEIVSHDAFRKGKLSLALALGKNIVGAPVTMDLAKMPHLLVAGATGAGKSVSINAMICSLLLRYTPEEVRLIMVDPKYLELSGYNDIPHLMLPVVTDPKKASIALRWAVAEMERRYQLLADMRVRDIISYNKKVDSLRAGEEEEHAVAEQSEAEAAVAAPLPVAEARPSKVLVVRVNPDGSEEPVAGEGSVAEGAEAAPVAEDGEAPEEIAPAPRARRVGKLPRRLPFIVVVIDEFADLMMVASKDVETSVARLAQKARAAGIHVILATQRPSVDVITGLIKANFPSRISFQVASNHDSKTILGTQGAENLLGSGDMLVMDRGVEMKRVHGAYISDREIRRVIDWLREQGRPIYDMEILKPPPDEDDQDGGAGLAEEGADENYDEAVAIVAETRQASISMIQRRLRVGYNRAARMVERMEREGIVGPQDPITKTREVMVQNHGLELPRRPPPPGR
jgi:S-DNA-T family DNA segregation ATPase FtsK/SpoIIIE